MLAKKIEISTWYDRTTQETQIPTFNLVKKAHFTILLWQKGLVLNKRSMELLFLYTVAYGTYAYMCAHFVAVYAESITFQLTKIYFWRAGMFSF